MEISKMTIRISWTVYLFWFVLVCASCHKKSTISDPEDDFVKLKLTYAQGFEVEYHQGFKLLRVTHPWKGSKESFTYILGHGIQKDKIKVAYTTFINSPIQRLVSTSTSHLPMLEMIGQQEALVGFQNTAFISSETFIKKAEDGSLIDVGMSSGLNIEKLIELDPQVVINYATGNEFDQLDILERSGIPYILNADYLEKTPLGRAEWIKFFGVLFDQEEAADSIFNTIEKNYQQIVSKVTDTSVRPTVFTGVMYGDTWFLPGGENYAARFFEDAGARYLWDESTEDGWLELSFESVYDRALKADYWLGCASFNTFDEMAQTDSRYALFNAFKNKKVYNYNAQIGKNGGNNYLELGYARPDIVLSDLIHILHPELSTEHSLFFYKRIE